MDDDVGSIVGDSAFIFTGQTVERAPFLKGSGASVFSGPGAERPAPEVGPRRGSPRSEDPKDGGVGLAERFGGPERPLGGDAYDDGPEAAGMSTRDADASRKLDAVYQKNAARMHLAKPEIEAINKLAQTHSQDKEALERYQGEIWKIWQKYDCNPVKMFAPLLVQAPVFISFFIAIQRMSAGVPSFATGGDLWFADLSAADATYALPLLSSLTFLASVETSPPNGSDPNAAPGMKWGMRALAAVMIPLTASFPQGVFVYRVTTNFFSLAQATALRAPVLKKLAGIPDVPTVVAAAAQPTAGGARKIAEKFGDAPAMHASNPKVRVSEDRATSKVFFSFRRPRRE